jgi:hypothetical protein
LVTLSSCNATRIPCILTHFSSPQVTMHCLLPVAIAETITPSSKPCHPSVRRVSSSPPPKTPIQPSLLLRLWREQSSFLLSLSSTPACLPHIFHPHLPISKSPNPLPTHPHRQPGHWATQPANSNPRPTTHPIACMPTRPPGCLMALPCHYQHKQLHALLVQCTIPLTRAGQSGCADSSPVCGMNPARAASNWPSVHIPFKRHPHVSSLRLFCT